MVDKVRHMEKGEGVNFSDGTTGKMIEMGVTTPSRSPARLAVGCFRGCPDPHH